MKLCKLIEKLERLETVPAGSVPELDITGVTCDSRAVKPGFAFVAVRGFESDGHRFIGSAVQAGASLIVCEELPAEISGETLYIVVANSRRALALLSCAFFGDPSDAMTVIGVTGTSGKTTSTNLIRHILEASGAKVGLIGTNGNMIGDRMLHTEHTTPDSPELQQLLAEMRDEGCTHVVMEVSSHAIVLDRVAGIHYDVAAYTNLSQDHLDFHGTMDAYAEAKSLLFGMCDAACINSDDSYASLMLSAARRNGCRITEYSADFTADAASGGEAVPVADAVPGRDAVPSGDTVPAADAVLVWESCSASGMASNETVSASVLLHADAVTLSASGVRFRACCSQTGTEVCAPGSPAEVSGAAEEAEISLAIPGGFSVYNALTAISVCMACGLSLGQCAAALADAKGVKGRVENVPTDGDYTVLIDYSHKPDALEKVLKTLRPVTRGRLVVLFGCGGDRDRKKRPIMGKVAVDNADVAIVTNDNPRTEDPHAIIAEILEGIRDTDTPVRVIPDRIQAIHWAIDNAAPGDVILLAGKGHEDYQVIGHEKHHMDEREIVAEWLEERKKRMP